jgi:hypothetical protein
MNLAPIPRRLPAGPDDTAIYPTASVQLSSERVRQAVRQDCSFAKRQESPPRFWSPSAGGVCSAAVKTPAFVAKQRRVGLGSVAWWVSVP